jgi:Folylpolyglutamate synthase
MPDNGGGSWEAWGGQAGSWNASIYVWRIWRNGDSFGGTASDWKCGYCFGSG